MITLTGDTIGILQQRITSIIQSDFHEYELGQTIEVESEDHVLEAIVTSIKYVRILNLSESDVKTSGFDHPYDVSGQLGVDTFEKVTVIGIKVKFGMPY